MMNFFCDQRDCGGLAQVFGFTSGATKTKACSAHMRNLTDKGLAIFEIEAYNFIQFPQDVPLYEQRKDMMQKGMMNLAALESRCEASLEECERSIQTVRGSLIETIERHCQEMRFTVQMQYQKVRGDLNENRSYLEKLITEKQLQLSSKTLAFCFEVVREKLFILDIEDATLCISQILKTRFRLRSVEDGLESAVAREDCVEKLRLCQAAKPDVAISTESVRTAKAIASPRCSYCQVIIEHIPYFCSCREVFLS